MVAMPCKKAGQYACPAFYNARFLRQRDLNRGDVARCITHADFDDGAGFDFGNLALRHHRFNGSNDFLATRIENTISGGQSVPLVFVFLGAYDVDLKWPLRRPGSSTASVASSALTSALSSAFASGLAALSSVLPSVFSFASSFLSSSFFSSSGTKMRHSAPTIGESSSLAVARTRHAPSCFCDGLAVQFRRGIINGKRLRN